MEGLVMDAGFWRGRRVLVTGHTGFKGGWLVLFLSQMGAKVCGYARSPYTEPSLFSVADVASVCESHIGDIRDQRELEGIMEAFKPEIVFHLAAQALVRQSYQDPIETYSTNVLGLAIVFEAIRRSPSVKVIVNVTSDKCYENNEWIWGYREIDPMGGYDPYSSSKGCAELVTAAYRRSFFSSSGVALASARAGNVIGGGDWALDRLIPDFVRAVTVGEQLVIRMPHATRPWQHVLEPLSGYITLAQHLFHGGDAVAGAWNFGPSDESVKSVAWIAAKTCELWGNDARWRVAELSDLHEAQSLRLDSSKARHFLGWTARWTTETAIARVVEWHKYHLLGEEMQRICYSQISDYLNSDPR